MNKHDILRQLMSLASSEADDDAPIRPLPLAQAIGLRERWQRYNQGDTLIPGDLVKEKLGLSVLKSEYKGTVVMMLWRFLSPYDPTDAEIIKDHVRTAHINRVDCVVAYLDDDGGHMVFMPHELARLERMGEIG